MTERLEDSAYPCVFAQRGAHAGSLRFAAIQSSHDKAAVAALAESCTRFLAESPLIGRYPTLLLMTGDQVAAATDAHDIGWRLLRQMSVHVNGSLDEWPANEEQGVAWRFELDGYGAFVVGLGPHHLARASRWAPGLCLAIQPIWAFGGLQAGTVTGARVRDHIYSLLKAYDAALPIPELLDWAGTGEYEWRRYFIADDEGRMRLDLDADHPPLADGTRDAACPGWESK